MTPPYVDLGNLPEDERIRIIVEVVHTGHTVAFVVDDDAKADRYLRKLKRQLPDLVVLDRLPGPAGPGSVLLRVGPVTH